MNYYQSLTEQHQTILSLLASLEKEILKIKEDQKFNNISELKKILSKLSSTLKDHLLLEDEFMYPVLREHPNKEIRELAEKFSKEMGGLKHAFSAYINKWVPLENIKTSPSAFISDTKTIISALQIRIAKEEKILFPNIKYNKHKTLITNKTPYKKWLFFLIGISTIVLLSVWLYLQIK
ncbi:hemerythrin domain-containing protein [Desulfonauticus submarinus]